MTLQQLIDEAHALSLAAQRDGVLPIHRQDFAAAAEARLRRARELIANQGSTHERIRAKAGTEKGAS